MPRGTHISDIVIVGAGVIGCSVARALARRGARVTVVEAQDRSREASWAAAGMLAPHAEFDEPTPLFRLGRASLALHPALSEELRQATGIDPGLRHDGTLLPIRSEADERRIEAKRLFLQGEGVRSRVLDDTEIRREEPSLSLSVRGALEVPDLCVDNRLLWQALAADCRRLGVTIAYDQPIERAEMDGDRVRLLQSATDAFAADQFVVAAGAWSATIGRVLGLSLPVEPVKGQLMRFGVRPGFLRRVIHDPGIYLVPRSGGGVVVGATVETAGFDKGLTDRGLAAVHGAALAMAPGLAKCPMVERWAGLRPRLPDGLPALGRSPRHANLAIATGHYRNGILLAPITGELLAALVLGKEPGFDLAPFAPGRFGVALSTSQAAPNRV